MPGTKNGAAKGAETKRQKYGDDFFARIGAEGGKKSKGRVISEETRKKISETKKGQQREDNTTSS